MISKFFETKKNLYQSYQLYILLKEGLSLTVGQLGTFSFPYGWYVYTGSAKKNIGFRIHRHLSKKKKLHWHVDYLLDNPQTSIIHVNLSMRKECECNQKIGGQIIAAGFGSSDCKNRCGSHLKFISNNGNTLLEEILF